MSAHDSAQDNVRSAEHPAVKDPTAERKVAPMRGDWSGWSPWTEEQQERIDIKECTDARCMNVEVNVGYQGLVEDTVLSQSAGVGHELRTAWKAKLQTEGKVSSGKSLRATIFGSRELAQ